MELAEGENRKAIIARYRKASPEQVQKLYELWDGNGGKYTKKDIEVKFFGDFRSNGKRFTRLVWDNLRIDIEEKSILMRKCEALEDRVQALEDEMAKLRGALTMQPLPQHQQRQSDGALRQWQFP